MTETIQPPLLAWAWRIAVGDPAEEPRIAAHHEWLAAQPRPRGRRPALDRPARRVGPRRLAEVRPGLGLAGARAARLPAAGRAATGGSAGTRGGSATPAGRCSARSSTNVLWGLARLALGEPSITPALVDRLWDERRGLFLDEAQPGGARPAVETWAALAPLALPDLPEEIGRRLVEEHLLDPSALLAAGRRRPRSPPPSRASSRAAARGLDPPLLARPDLGQLGLAALARAAPARLRAEAAQRMADGLSERGRPRGPARVLRPAHRRGPRRDGLRLVEPRDRSWPTRTRRQPRATSRDELTTAPKGAALALSRSVRTTAVTCPGSRRTSRSVNRNISQPWRRSS